MSSEEFAQKFGLDSVGTNPEEGKKIAFKSFVDRIVSQISKIKDDKDFEGISVGFSDDDEGNVEVIEDLIRDELKRLHPEISFTVYDTSDPKDTKKKRAAFFKKKGGSYKKSDDNDDYKAAPGDKKAKTKQSTFTTKYKKMYGEDAPANATGTAVAGTGDDSSTVVMKKKKDKETMKDRLLRRFKIKETIDRTVPDLERPKDEIKEKVKHLKAMAMNEADLDEAIKGLQNKAKKTGMPYSILKQVYNRGMAAWKGGHRPGATQQQWAFARVNSFVTKSSGTWGGADKDLAKKVRGSK